MQNDSKLSSGNLLEIKKTKPSSYKNVVVEDIYFLKNRRCLTPGHAKVCV